MADEQRVKRREPWPWILAGMLGSMITVSCLFLWTAIRHPDPPVVEDAYRAGLEYARDFQTPTGTTTPTGDTTPTPSDE